MKLPLITSSPHDSDDFSSLKDRVQLSSWFIEEFSDKYTADTAFHPKAIGNLKSKVTRGLGSLNQPRDKSLFKEEDFHGNKIWKKGKDLTDAEKEFWLSNHHDLYHKEIERLIKLSRSQGFEKIILWDHHDTGDYNPRSGKRDRKLPEGRIMPKFILSNFGLPNSGEIDPKNGFSTTTSEFIQTVRKFIAEEFSVMLYEVEINTIFKGGHIIQRYGNPSNNFGNKVSAIQIEYNRGFIMDQATREPYWDTIREFNRKFNRVMEKACELL